MNAVSIKNNAPWCKSYRAHTPGYLRHRLTAISFNERSFHHPVVQIIPCTRAWMVVPAWAGSTPALANPKGSADPSRTDTITIRNRLDEIALASLRVDPVPCCRVCRGGWMDGWMEGWVGGRTGVCFVFSE